MPKNVIQVKLLGRDIPDSVASMIILHTILDNALDPKCREYKLANPDDEQRAKTLKSEMKTSLAARAKGGCSEARRYAVKRGWEGFAYSQAAE